jgi:hypothetical protein
MRRATPEIILFESILLSALITILVVVCYYAIQCMRKKTKFGYENFLSLLLSLLMFYSLSFSIIMNTDRSKSLYVLSWVHDLGPISEENLAKEVKKKYGEYDATYIQQRIIEHKSRGVFIERNGLVQTSNLGNLYWNVANKIAGVFKLSGWFSSKIQR